MNGIIIREVSRKNIKKNDVMMTYRFSHVYVRLYDEKVERIFQILSFRLHFFFVKRIYTEKAGREIVFQNTVPISEDNDDVHFELFDWIDLHQFESDVKIK
jgi:hypothetical protein